MCAFVQRQDTLGRRTARCGAGIAAVSMIVTLASYASGRVLVASIGAFFALLGLVVITTAPLDFDEEFLAPRKRSAVLYYMFSLVYLGWGVAEANSHPALVLVPFPPLIMLCVGWHIRGKPVTSVRFELRPTTLISAWVVFVWVGHAISIVHTAGSACCLIYVSDMARWGLFTFALVRTLCTPALLYWWDQVQRTSGATRALYSIAWLDILVDGSKFVFNDLAWAQGTMHDGWGKVKHINSEGKTWSDGWVPGLEVKLLGVIMVIAAFIWLCLRTQIYGTAQPLYTQCSSQ